MVRRRCDDGSLVAVKSNKGQWRIHPESVEQLGGKMTMLDDRPATVPTLEEAFEGPRLARGRS